MLSFVKHNLHMLTMFQAFLFMALITLPQFRKNRANRFLFFFLLFLVCSEFGGFLNHLIIIRYTLSRLVPSLYFFGMPLSFLMFPFLYFYVRSSTSGEFRLKPTDVIHFIPFLTVFTYVIIEYLSKDSNSIRMIAMYNYNLFTSLEYQNMRLIRIIQILVYIVLSVRIIIIYKRNINDIFSTTSEINLNWLVFFLALIGVWGGFETAALVVYKNNMHYYPYAYLLSSLFLLLIITGLFLRALSQQQIILPEKIRSTGKYQKNLLSEEEKNRYLKNLVEFMQNEKPYLEPEITVKDLSRKTNIPSHYISQILNTSLNQNFYDFINNYRIKESLRLIKEYPEQPKTIIEVLYESGFNSKSTFNAAFKKYTGMTPSQFKEKIQETAEEAS